MYFKSKIYPEVLYAQNGSLLHANLLVLSLSFSFNKVDQIKEKK